MSAVAMVVRMIGRLSAPTAAIWARFNPKPSRMTAYCSTFFAVKPMPSCTMPRAGCFHQRAMTMPMRMANTGPPTTGSASPRNQQGMAMAAHRPTPGATFFTFATMSSSRHEMSTAIAEYSTHGWTDREL